MAAILPVHGVYRGSEVIAYCKTSDVYGETLGVGAKVSIKKIPEANLTGRETIVPIKELLRTATIMRLRITYSNSDNKKKSALILATKEAVSKLFSATTPPADLLEGTTYKVNGVEKGSISLVNYPRRSVLY